MKFWLPLTFLLITGCQPSVSHYPAPDSYKASGGIHLRFNF